MLTGDITYGDFAIVMLICAIISVYVLGGVTVVVLLFGRKR